MGLMDVLGQQPGQDPTAGIDPALLQQLMQLGTVDQRHKLLQTQLDRADQTAAGAPVDYTHGKGTPLLLAGLANLVSAGVGGYQAGKAQGGLRDLVEGPDQARGVFGQKWEDAQKPVQAPPDLIAAPGMDAASQETARQGKISGLRNLAMLSGDPRLIGMVRAGPQMALQDQELAEGQQKLAAGSRAAEAENSPATGIARRVLLKRFGMTAPEGTPNATLKEMEGVAEKAYSADQSAKARVTAAGMGGGAGGDNVKTIGDAIIAGQQPPDLKGMYRFAAPVRAYLAKQGFDLGSAQQEWTATQKHLATMNGQQQERLRQAVSFTGESLNKLQGLYDDWKAVGAQTGIKAFNRLSLTAAKNLPGDAGAAAQALEAQINDTVAELGNVYMGGNSPTDHAMQLAKQNLSADWNDETFKKALDLARSNLQLRANAMNTATAGGSRYDAAPPTVQPAAPAQKKKRWDPAAGKIVED